MARGSRSDRSAVVDAVVLAVGASLPFVAVAVALGVHHWVPTGDDAVIAWRSFDVLAGHGALVGHVNQAGGAGTVYDPGPLEELALALPVRLAPGGVGAVVGATLVEIGAVATMAVAVVRTAGRLAATLVVAGSLLGAWSAAAVLGDPVWNPFAALVPFAATIVLGWVVATGALGWWPVVVGFASYCAQCHLVYAPAAVLVAVTAPVVGLAVRSGRRRGGLPWRWAVVGLTVAVGAWAAPLWQQLTGRPGNLGALWNATVGAHHQATIGWWAALDQLGRGMGPLPDWWRPPGGNPSGLALLVLHGRQGWTVAALALLVALVVVALLRRRHDVAALGGVVLAADLGGLVALAGTPVAKDLVLSYVTWVVWPLGMATWFALGWGTFRLVVGPVVPARSAGLVDSAGPIGPVEPAGPIGRVSSAGLVGPAGSVDSAGRVAGPVEPIGPVEPQAGRGSASGPALGPGPTARVWAVRSALVAVAVAVAVVAGVSVERWDPGGASSVQADGRVAVAVARLVEHGQVPPHERLEVVVDNPLALELAPAIAYQLVVAGRHPTLSVLSDQVAPVYRARPGDAVLAVDPGTGDRPGARGLGTVVTRDPDGGEQAWTVSYRP